MTPDDRSAQIQAALQELERERERAAALLRAITPHERAKAIVFAVRERLKTGVFPEEIEDIFRGLEHDIQSAIILHANKEVELRRAATIDYQRAKDFLQNVACSGWYRPEDREPSLGDTVLIRVERNGVQYYRLGNHEPDERVVCWARIYPPRQR